MWWLGLWLCAGSLRADQEVSVDVCVYGGTSGGVIAAVKAARLGKHVAIICDKNHFGGMTSSGLGWTDTGNYPSYIQGMALEFYDRINTNYGSNVNFHFEPHVAEAVFDQMLAQAGVMLFTNQYVISAAKQGTQITAIRTSAGNIFEAKEYIDASYTGDLMAAAGVTWTIGRESISQYGESLAGIRPPDSSFGAGVNPYVISNVPSSGLIPLVETNTLGVLGAADSLVQTYNFRMCFTQVSSNRMALTAPTNYNIAEYELVARYLEAFPTSTLSDLMTLGTPVANNKMDINNAGAVSTDFIGESSAYSTASPAQRSQIWADHKNYEQGFFYFLATDPRIPAAIQSAMLTWGTCKDEFTDNGGWPWELYVRESRRMVSDFVMTQSNILSPSSLPDSVGLGGYYTDCHYCERILTNGVIVNEGSAKGDITGPYPIPYRTLVPKTNDCSNLLVPWSLSASHIAFCSIRMEPTFMILSQSAATAACMAMDDGVPVQSVNITKLQSQLTVDAQNFGTGIWSNGTASIIVDNADPTGVTIVGLWTNSSSSSGYYGVDYLHDGNANKGLDSVTFQPNLPQAGQYQVYDRWTQNANRSTNTPIDVGYPNGTNTFIVNQTVNGGQWNLLMTTNFNAGTNGFVRVRNGGTTGYVIADAVEFIYNLPVVSLWAADGQASRYGLNPATIMLTRSGGTNTALSVNLNFTGTAVDGVDYSNVSPTITFPAGISTLSFNIAPLTNAAPVGARTVVITLATNANYLAGTLSNASLMISDTPINTWKYSYFGANAGNPSIGGDAASPAGDGVANILKYALGLNPLAKATNSLFTCGIDTNGYFDLTYTRPDPPPADINYQVVSSSNLVTWMTNGAGVQAGPITLNANGTAAVTTDTLLPAGSQPEQFLNLQVSSK